MPPSLTANTYGVGELITQRKLLVVPEHQRSFSWSQEQVDQYLADVASAIEKDAGDYFIGLIVLQGPIHGVWRILDGQQRLATTTMLYSAICQWLLDNRHPEDSRQIETEFLGVRQLGGVYTSRLGLNVDNRGVFDEYVVERATDGELREASQGWPRRSSNHLLLNAARRCRTWIKSYVSTLDVTRRPRALFELAAFIEKRVKVVCVDVTTETDAYVLFESLNDRGLELSALDLVKNYIFSFTSQQTLNQFTDAWGVLAQNIDGKDADDFLKVFWTSRFGIVPKFDIFNRVRDEYPKLSGVESLLNELADASEKIEAIEDPEHGLWRGFDTTVRDRLTQLITLGSRQIRPVILSAMSRLESGEVASLLWYLIVLIVRYQLIGRERTGVLEKALGRLAPAIWRGEVTTAVGAMAYFSELIPNDEEFRSKFELHSEAKAARIGYLLGSMEAFNCQRSGLPSGPDWRVLLQGSSPIRIALDRTIEDEVDESDLSNIGNFVLLEDELIQRIDIEKLTPIQIREIYSSSSNTLTSSVACSSHWNAEAIRQRSTILGDIATKVWATDAHRNSARQ